jgi:ABC-type lipoprotein release transport system permease subunit
VAAMAISVGATLLPARAAARLLPVDVLRYE